MIPAPPTIRAARRPPDVAGPCDAIIYGSPGTRAELCGDVVALSIDSDAVHRAGKLSIDLPPNRARFVTVEVYGSLATRFANRWRRQIRRDFDRRRQNRLRRKAARAPLVTWCGSDGLVWKLTAPP